MPLTELAESVLGKPTSETTSIEESPIVNHTYQNQHNKVNDQYIKGYTSPVKTRPFSTGTGTRNDIDFQIGSVILPVPPTIVRVNRSRDVDTVPVMRGTSIPARQGEGIVSIDLSIEIPDYTDRYGEVNPLTAMIAEFKVSPFTVIRNRDLSSKLSQVDIREPAADVQAALANITRFQDAERRFRKLFDQFFVTTSILGNEVAADWQTRLRIELSNVVADITSSPGSFHFTKSEKLEGEYFDAIQSTEGRTASEIISTLFNIFTSGEIAPSGGLSSRQEFGPEKWDSWRRIWESNTWQQDVRSAIYDLILASKVQIEINAQYARSADATQVPKPPRFIPVVLQRMVLTTLPGRPGTMRVDMSFELFNFRAYVDRLEWHHYNTRLGQWTSTDDPAKADLLLRWRDLQFIGNLGTTQAGYMNMGAITAEALNKSFTTTVSGISTGDTIPGYIKYLRAAWNNRRCVTPTHKASEHQLRLFYPDTIPQINSAAAQPKASHYRELVIDDGGTKGITHSVQVVWDLAIARQVDEFTGIVTHQATGGSNLSVRFEVVVPIHSTPQEGAPIFSHEELIGRVNKMFDAIDQNRRLLPSDAFMPTSVFIKNPITQMMGAYVFEPGDMPVTQYEPGAARIQLSFTEATPVVGLGQTTFTTSTSVSRAHAFAITSGLYLWYNTGAADKLRRTNLAAWTNGRKAANVTNILDVPNYNRELRAKVTAEELANIPAIAIRAFKMGEAEGILNTSTYGDWTPLTVGPAVLHAGWKYYLDDNRIYAGDVPDSPELKLRKAIHVAILRFLDPTTKGDLGFYSDLVPSDQIPKIIDPLSVIVALLNKNYSEDSEQRANYILRTFCPLEQFTMSHATAAVNHIPSEFETSIQRFLRGSGFAPAAVITELLNRAEANVESIIVESPSHSYMLYPDMILPTYQEVLGINPSLTDSAIPADHLVRFIPTFAEYGIITGNSEQQHRPGRSIKDIADPDVWFYRQVEKPELQSESQDSITYDSENKVNFIQPNTRTPTTRNGKSGTPFLGLEAEQLKNVADMGRMDTKDALGVVDIEQLSKPNRRRMLFAFPTYLMEFTIDGQKASRLYETSRLPLNWELKLINALPVIKMDVILDEFRPSIANVQFVARRAALRNESWTLLPPEVEQDTDTFTNIPSSVIDILNKDFPLRSDSTLLTKLAMAPGTRVSVRMGYGTNLRNLELLPVLVAGTIGEVALGEVSTMVVQDIGMQLMNPVESTIGGGGNYSPNRIWSGKFTMRAFTDIFHSLDTRFMGRTHRGIENDLTTLTDEEVNRIYDIGVQTRNSVEIFRSDYSETAFSSAYSLFHSPAASFLRWTGGAGILGSVLTSSSVFGTVSELVRDKTSRFFPELLNVYPCVSGVGDWAISNTDTKSIPAIYWIDMMARLSPGACWWVHPFGNESRLFFGRPEQFYRKHSFNISGTRASAYYTMIATSVGGSLAQERLDPVNFAKRLVADGIPTWAPTEIASWDDVIPAMAGFEELLANPSSVDLYYRHILAEIIRADVRDRTGVEIEDVLELARDPRPILPEDEGRPLRLASIQAKTYRQLVGAEDPKLDSFTFASEFPSPEAFASFLRALSRVERKEGQMADIDTAPSQWPDNQSKHYIHSILPKFAALLMRAIDDPERVKLVQKVSQISVPLTRARHALGYRRFRQYHHAISGRDLLTNRMIVSQAKMANSVAVDNYTIGYSVLPFERRTVGLDADVENLNFGIFQWFKGLLGANDRDSVLGILIPNALARGMARMYDGIIELRGNPNIKPHDIIYILDLHNGVYGPVKCRTVTHSLDGVTGFVTRVVPEMHTQSFSSRVLTEHVAHQRILKTIATTAVVAGIASVATLNPIGLIVGLGLALSASAISTYASLSDTIARRQLVNFSAAETLANAKNRSEVELVMKQMMMDTFVSSNKIKVISPTQAQESKLIQRMANLERPELGVSIFPLMRFGSYLPLVAGLRTEGLLPLDQGPGAVLRETYDIVKGAALDLLNYQFLDYIGEKLDNASIGYRATINSVKQQIERSRRAEEALRARGVNIR